MSSNTFFADTTPSKGIAKLFFVLKDYILVYMKEQGTHFDLPESVNLYISADKRRYRVDSVALSPETWEKIQMYEQQPLFDFKADIFKVSCTLVRENKKRVRNTVFTIHAGGVLAFNYEPLGNESEPVRKRSRVTGYNSEFPPLKA